MLDGSTTEQRGLRARRFVFVGSCLVFATIAAMCQVEAPMSVPVRPLDEPGIVVGRVVADLARACARAHGGLRRDALQRVLRGRGHHAARGAGDQSPLAGGPLAPRKPDVVREPGLYAGGARDREGGRRIMGDVPRARGAAAAGDERRRKELISSRRHRSRPGASRSRGSGSTSPAGSTRRSSSAPPSSGGCPCRRCTRPRCPGRSRAA